MVWGWILGIGIPVIIIIIFIYYFNRFVVLENRIENSSAQIDVQLKKRADLVPSLVKVVKSYAKFERDVLTEVTKSRTQMISGRNIAEKVRAGDKLQNALKSIFAVS